MRPLPLPLPSFVSTKWAITVVYYVYFIFNDNVLVADRDGRLVMLRGTDDGIDPFHVKTYSESQEPREIQELITRG